MNIDAILASLTKPGRAGRLRHAQHASRRTCRRPRTIETVLQDIAGRSNGKFTYRFVDPDAADSGVTRQELYDQ